MYIIRKNNYNFSEEQLFVVGKRDNNKKRSFLFISKLLGKHLAVKPEVVKAFKAKLIVLLATPIDSSPSVEESMMIGVAVPAAL